MPVINLRSHWAPDPNLPDPMPDDTFASRTLLFRKVALGTSDWRMLPDAPGDVAPWVTYRAALRDGPTILATRNGDLVTLPDPPAE